MLDQISDNADNYKLLVEKMHLMCQQMETENERAVYRINNVKKLIRRRRRDVSLLMMRLDEHSDGWRSMPMVLPHPKRKIEQKRGPKPKIKPNVPVVPKEIKEKKARKPRAPNANKTQKLNQVRQLQGPYGIITTKVGIGQPHQQSELLTQEQVEQLMAVNKQRIQFECNFKN